MLAIIDTRPPYVNDPLAVSLAAHLALVTALRRYIDPAAPVRGTTREFPMRVSEVRSRLFKLIDRMAVKDQVELLNYLERAQDIEKRQHRRKSVRQTVYYAVEDRAYKDAIRDLSAGGVYIQTQRNFFIGQEILISIKLLRNGQSIQIPGEIAWKDHHGIGVKFTQSIQKLIDLARKASPA
jgi:Tfp pilus assembly protein PilZ